jgi:hypothetical protein
MGPGRAMQGTAKDVLKVSKSFFYQLFSQSRLVSINLGMV